MNKLGWAAKRRRQMAAAVKQKPAAKPSEARSVRVSRGKVAAAAKRARRIRKRSHR